MRLALLACLTLAACLGQVMPMGEPGDPTPPSVNGPMTSDAAADADAAVEVVDLGTPPDMVVPTSSAGATKAEVCMRYQTSGVVPAAFFSKTAATCDPGVLTADGIASAVARINFYRWLTGLAPVTASASANDLAQKCALVSAWNPAGPQAHTPPPTA